MRSVLGAKRGERLLVLYVEDYWGVVGGARHTEGHIGTVHRVYRKPVNRGRPSVELEFPSGERYVYVAEEVCRV